MTVLLVDNALALKSMRNSDFDAYSAFGEVIDNSIQAGAKDIQLLVSYQPKTNKAFEAIRSLTFVDDGHGMDTEVLHRCLQLGYSSRYNDRSGIGRFGVGMTLGAINQCMRVDVYSKQAGSGWYRTHIDLVEIEQAHDADEPSGIEAPKAVDLPKELAAIAPKKAGTIVVWSKYDRQPETASIMVDEMRVWIGRTYRYFIWEDGLRVRVNGLEVPAIDPLYARTEKTNFPNDPKAELYEPITIEWPVPTDDLVEGGPKKSKIEIQMSLLPVALRPVKGSGGSPEARARHIDRNQGLSIIRNRREVFYGEVPYWPNKAFFEEIDRWWGCEIRFDAVLDKAFTVKNIKRGAVPVTELKKLIYDKISPTRQSAIENIRDVWAKAAAEQAKGGSTDGDAVDTGHSEAELVAKKTQTPKSQIDKGKKLDDEAAQLAKQVAKDADAGARTRWELKFKSQPFTIVDSDWKGPVFIEVHHLGGKDVLKYNLQHVFFQAAKAIQKQVDQGEDLAGCARRMKALIDLLLISFSKSEAMFERGGEFKVEDFLELLHANWGQYLQQYIKTWVDTHEIALEGQ